jgi:hypothetical protein
MGVLVGTGMPDDGWLDRLSGSLREHEEKRDQIASFPPRYEVLEEISRGGMGTVYRAWDPQLGRNVALKVLRSEDGSAAEAHERFQREARLAASLHHPHIVPIYDSGTWQGQDYIAMQLLEGQTLAHVRPDRRTALTCIRDAARALHYAHGEGIVHRDIKPSNLMLDGNGRVYVADFGVARQSVATASMTTPGTVVGTPAYMSPEQAMGLPADARSDVYSLGATLYELLTGKAPFDGDPHAVIEAVRTREPETARRMLRDLSKNVEAILAGAMERKPEDRYPSAAALADDIDRYLAGERPTRRPRGLSYRVQREFVRHPWRSGGTILLCLLLVMAGVVLGYFIRGFVHLQLGWQEKDRDLRKKHFKIAEFFFKDAVIELAEIERQEKDEARLVARKAAEARERALAQASAEEKRRIQENAEKLRLEADEAKRKLLISETYEAVLKALRDHTLTNIPVPLESLKTAAPDKYLELLPLVRDAEFNQGMELLNALASKGAEEEFPAVYARLSGSEYAEISDRKTRLFKPVFNFAAELVSRKQLRGALRWLNEAESLSIPDASFYRLRGTTLLELQDWEGAQKDLDLLIGANRAGELPPPAFAVLAYRKGHEALLREAWSEAIRQFAIATHIDSRHAMAHHDRGIARFRSGRHPREVLDQDLRTALEINPDLKIAPEYREVTLAYSKAQTEEFWAAEDAQKRDTAWHAAIAWLTDIGKRLGDSPALLIEKAKMYRRLRNYDAALSCLSGQPETAELLRIRGQIIFEKAFEHAKDPVQLSKALADFDHAVIVDPKNALAIYWRGTCNHSAGNIANALEDLNSSRNLGLDTADLHYQLGLLKLTLRDAAPSIESATSALARASTLTEEGFIANLYELRGLSRSSGIRLLERDSLFCRARAQFDLSQFQSCSEDCTRILAADPRFYKALILRGESACREKRYTEALKDFDEAYSVASTKQERDDAAQRRENCARHP